MKTFSGPRIFLAPSGRRAGAAPRTAAGHSGYETTATGSEVPLGLPLLNAGRDALGFSERSTVGLGVRRLSWMRGRGDLEMAIASADLAESDRRWDDDGKAKSVPLVESLRVPGSQLRRRRVGAYGVALDSDAENVLLTRLSPADPESGKWTLPGGGLEPNESLSQGLRRELHEETSMTLREADLAMVTSAFYPAWGGRSAVHAVALIYSVSVQGNPEVLEVGGSTIDARWVPIGEARSMETTWHTEVALTEIAFDGVHRAT